MLTGPPETLVVFLAPLAALLLVSPQVSPVIARFDPPAMLLKHWHFHLTPEGKRVTDGVTWFDLATESVVPPPDAVKGDDCVLTLADGSYVTYPGGGFHRHDSKTVRTLSFSPASFFDCQLDPDGKRVARLVEVGKERHRIEVAEWPAAGEAAVWKVVADNLKSCPWLRFNATGTHLLWSHPSSSSLIVHSFATGKAVRLDPKDEDQNGCRNGGTAIDAQGKRAAVLTDKATLLFDLGTGKCERVIPHSPGIDPTHRCVVAFTPDGKTLLASGLNPRRIERIPTDEKEKPGFIEVGDGDWVSEFAVTPDSKGVVVRDYEGVIRVYDLATGKRLDRGTRETWQGVTWLDENRAVCWSRRGRVVVWDARTGKAEREFTVGPLDDTSHGVGRLTVTPDGKHLAVVEERSCAEYGRVRVFDAGTGKQLFALPDRLHVKDLAFRPDGGELGVSVTDPDAPYDKQSTLRRYAVPTGKQVGMLPSAPDHFRYAADGRSVVTVGVCNEFIKERYLQWVELASGKPRWATLLYEWDFHSGWLLGIDEERQTVWLATDGEATQVYNRSTGKAKETVAIEYARVSHQSTSSDNRWLVQMYRRFIPGVCVMSYGNIEIAVHDLRDSSPGAAPLDVPSGADWLRGAAIRPDGKRLILLAPDGGMRVLDLDKLRALQDRVVEAWEDLAADDPEPAAEAMALLARSPERAVKMLAEKLPAVAEVNADDVKRWLGELGSADFKTRDRAEKNLETVLDPARKLIRAAAENPTNEEAGDRLARLVAKIDTLAARPDGLRVVRAVEVAERLRTPAAVKLLEAWAGGAPDALLTTEAKASLKRVKK